MNSKPASEINIGDTIISSDGFQFKVTGKSWVGRNEDRIRITAHSDFSIATPNKTFTVKPFTMIRTEA